jgi:hypothetical protein
MKSCNFVSVLDGHGMSVLMTFDIYMTNCLWFQSALFLLSVLDGHLYSRAQIFIHKKHYISWLDTCGHGFQCLCTQTTSFFLSVLDTHLGTDVSISERHPDDSISSVRPSQTYMLMTFNPYEHKGLQFSVHLGVLGQTSGFTFSLSSLPFSFSHQIPEEKGRCPRGENPLVVPINHLYNRERRKGRER